jgi:hypothetical protein
MIEAKEMQRNGEAVNTGEERMKNKQTVEGRPDKSRVSRSEDGFAALFGKNGAEHFRTHWLEIQSRFVEDPNLSVKQADELVTNLIKNIMGTFADNRTSLEKQWKSGDKVSTEDLRVALKRYRSLFNRLLSLEP